jgi:hypothetical protein
MFSLFQTFGAYSTLCGQPKTFIESDTTNNKSFLPQRWGTFSAVDEDCIYIKKGFAMYNVIKND